MAQQPKPKRDNSGSLWKNRQKKTENHPDFTGEVTVSGRDYWISGWVRETSQGKRFTSLAFRPKAPKPEYVPPPRRSREPGEDDDKNGDLPL